MKGIFMSKVFSRRSALKMGLGASLGATTALYAPAVLSSDAPVIRYLGTAVNMGDEIEKKLFEDTGIKVQYISKTTDEVIRSGIVMKHRDCQPCFPFQRQGFGG